MAFKAGKRLASVLVPSGRNVEGARNSHVLERIGIDHLGRVGHGLPSLGRDRCGYACPKKDGNYRVLEKIGID